MRRQFGVTWMVVVKANIGLASVSLGNDTCRILKLGVPSVSRWIAGTSSVVHILRFI